jgi:type II secretory ATPase GspE/PulE/Tfp pilus assembly ATPase PilB-like protein/ActR/RegA family two-component response regulator
MNPTYELPVNERFRDIVQRAYPNRPDVATVPLAGPLRDTWRNLARAAGADVADLAKAIARELDLDVAGDLNDSDPFATRLVPERIATEVLVLPMRERDGTLVVAAACPFPGGGLRRVQFLADRKLKVLVAPADAIEAVIPKAYARAAEQRAESIGTIALTEGGDPAKLSAKDDSAVVRLARALILQSVEQRASDLHIEPFAGGGIVRVRVDGILRRIAFIPGTVRDALVRYWKANGGMDPTNDRIAQDGRMSLILGSREIELRLSVLPASRGESLVVRFLDQSRIFRLGGSGFSTAALGCLRRLVMNSAGVIVVTGPTGSGKSSTLYAMLSEINRIGVKVVTIENPVEYRVPGISQVEVNAKAGLTFASALRSSLRQDPDIILVGEIRDGETAEIAMQAALTGHLVLTTLHTNDALSALPRLADLGVQPSLIADAMIGVVSQRLLRRLCDHCRAPVQEPLLADEALFLEATGERPAYRPVGCDQCNATGFLGRLPIAEIVEMTPDLRSAISRGERDLGRLRELTPTPLAAIADGAAKRIISGDTTAREAMRVLGQKFWTDTARLFNRTISAGAATAITAEESLSAGLSLLLFEREPLGRSELATAIEQTGVRVHTTGDPEQARQIVTDDDAVALLILDLETGDERDSLELLRQVRVSLAWARLPALIMVSPHHAQLRQLLEEHGMTDYLVKPVDTETIVSRLRAVLAR